MDYAQPPELDEAGYHTDSELLNTNQTTYDRIGAKEQCSNGSCPLDDPHPMELPWIQLMSPVAKPGQSIEPSFDPGVSQPHEGRFSEILGALRPSGVDDHAMATIRESWTTVVDDHLSAMPERLKLAELAQTWEGDDFDAFAEQVDVARSNLIETLGEIQTAVDELEVLEEQVYAAQGSGGEVPFPAPGVWKADSGIISGPKIHVRPAWHEGGDCDKDRDEGDNWEALGLPRETGFDLRALVDERARYFVEYHSMGPDEAQQQAEDDYEAANTLFISHWSDQMALASDTHNEAIIHRRDLVADSQDEPSLEHNQRTPPKTTAEDLDMTPPPLDPPPTPELPPPGGLDGYSPPGTQNTPDFPDPRTEWSGSQFTPSSATGPSSGGSSGGTDLWSPSSGLDSDGPSGGLASGASGLGGAGASGLGGGAGIGSGPGAGGSAGGMVAAPGGGSGGAGRGGGAGGRGQAGSGRGKGGMMGAGGGGRPAGASEGDQAGHETLLTEDEDVWGIVDEDDDPYA